MAHHRRGRHPVVVEAPESAGQQHGLSRIVLDLGGPREIDLCPADVRNVALVASRQIDTQQTVAQPVDGRYHRVTLTSPKLALRHDPPSHLPHGYLPLHHPNPGRPSALPPEVITHYCLATV